MSKRETILKTASRLFAAQGFDGTTTLQIAREAGVTEPLIYCHFKGKDDLIKTDIENLLPEPTRPAGADIDSRVENLYLARAKKAKETRSQISNLNLNGKGSDIKGVKGSLWGTFNAVWNSSIIMRKILETTLYRICSAQTLL